jgi:hypothetical protein
VKLDEALEAGSLACVRTVLHLAFGLQNFLDAFVAHDGLGEGIRHFRKLLHGLVHFAEVPDEHDQRTFRQASIEHHARAEPQNQARSEGHDDLHQGRQLSLDAAGLEGHFDAFQALFFQTALLEILAGEGFDHADGRKHFLDNGNHLAFFFADGAGRLLDTAGVGIDHQKQNRRHG